MNPKTSAPSTKSYVTAMGAAKILGRSRNAVTIMVEYGHLTPIGKLDGATGAWLFNRDDVIAFKKARDAKVNAIAGLYPAANAAE